MSATNTTATVVATTTSMAGSSTTAPPAPTTTGTTVPEIDFRPPEEISPEGPGPFPVVVLVHGGGWVAGDGDGFRPLARLLADEGFITLNTTYTLATPERPGFPEALDDIACAVRYARTMPGADGTVAILGHSAGAHLAAVVALTGDRYGAGCPFLGDPVPERLIGLAGPYDVRRVGFLMNPFFGGNAEELPDAWAAGNPQLLTDENPDLETLLLHGDSDGIVTIDFSYQFADALRESGSEVLMEPIEGATHLEVIEPAVVGDLIVTWLLR
jgi:acetyl esterase/lipase